MFEFQSELLQFQVLPVCLICNETSITYIITVIVLRPLSLVILLKYIAVITILLKQFNVLSTCSVICLENKSMQVVRLQCPYKFLKQISVQAYQNRGLYFYLLVLYYCCIFVFIHYVILRISVAFAIDCGQFYGMVLQCF